MGRTGEFFDQDNLPVRPAAPSGPSRAGRGVLYDQDATPSSDNRKERRVEARQRKEKDRLRDRELELARERAMERERGERRAQREAKNQSDSGPVRISSRPGAATSQSSASGRAGGPGSADEAVSRSTAPGALPALPGAPWTGPPAPPQARESVSRSPEAGGRPGYALPGAPWTAPAPPRPTQAPELFAPEPPRTPAPAPSPRSQAPRPPAPSQVRTRSTAGASPQQPPTRTDSPESPPPRVTYKAPPAPRLSRRSRRPTSTSEAAAVLAAGTFASRLTGFLRILVIGYVLGVSTLSDAFNYANGVPNIVYDLFLGGILAATLIPVFVEYLSDRSPAGARAISAVTTASLAGLAVITALLWLAAPSIIRFYLILSPSATGAEERALAVRLLHWFAPQVFFLGAIVISTALLNARRHFAVAAFSPVVNNAIAIAALLATKVVASSILTSKTNTPSETLDRFTHDGRAIVILGLGTTIGYVAQLLVQLPAQRRAAIRIRPIWDLRHPAVRRVARLSSWLIGVVIANQLSLALIMVLAGRTNGGLTAYQFSYQFFQLPYALIAVSVAAALMPDLAERWTNRDKRGFERQLVRGLRVTLALLVPVGFVYAAIAQPLIQVALHHGRVSASGAHLVSTSLALFALGLPGFSAFFLLIRGYQAMQDAKTMFLIYAAENALTVVFAVVLEPLLGVAGLALAWVAPYTVMCIAGARGLRLRGVSLGGAVTTRAITRIMAAGALTGLAAYGIGVVLPSEGSDITLAIRVLVQSGVGLVVYLAAARVLRIRELEPVAGLLRQLTGRGRKAQPV